MNLRSWASAVLLVMMYAPARAASYYVDPANGSDANTGTSPTAAFKTLQKAANSTHPGDTVYAMTGTYSAAADSQVLAISASGTASAPIIYTNYNGETPDVQLSDNNWWGITVAAGTQYIVINGFEVTGIDQSLTWAGANSARVSGLGNPKYNGAGISCSGSYDATTKKVTPVAHVVIENCAVHDCAQEGIASEHSDYLTIENNTIWNCSLYSSYEGSGISTWEDASVDSNAATYKMIINANTVYGCRAEIGNALGLQYSITDGNGIIIDGDGVGTTGISYTGKILITNNLVYNCGGRGINVNSAHNVDVVNNTLYRNSEAHSYADTHLNCGGPIVGKYGADKDFSGGSVDTPWTGAVDTSLVTNVAPAPTAVYHSERFGTTTSGFTYTIHEKPLCSYRIVLDLTEDHWNAANERQFNVSVNGNTWLTNFDIFAATGAMHKAIAQMCTDTSDPSGNITIAFTPGKYDAPKIDGIEVLSDPYAPYSETFYGSTTTATNDYHCYNNVLYPSTGLPAIGEYNIDPASVLSLK